MPAGIIAHDHHHEHERDREHRQRQKRHSPVEHEQIDDRQKRRDDVRRHFREQMRQRGFHAGYLIDDDFLQLAAGGVHHRAQRKARQLGEKRLADGFENAEGGSVRNGQRAIIQRRAHQIAAQRPYALDETLGTAAQFGGTSVDVFSAICSMQIPRFTSSKPSKFAFASDEKSIRRPTASFVRRCPCFSYRIPLWLDETNLWREKNCRSRQLGKLTAASRKSRRRPRDDTGSADGCIR